MHTQYIQFYFNLMHTIFKYAVAQLGETLRYKPEGRMFNFQWGL
jgi:hypothetical protein